MAERAGDQTVCSPYEIKEAARFARADRRTFLALDVELNSLDTKLLSCCCAIISDLEFVL